VAAGKKTLSFSMDDRLDWSEVAAAALGRSGNLRAPTIRSKDRVLVGYSDAAWEAFFEAA
jgi:arsenate reductase-like glutaredoxin family protein